MATYYQVRDNKGNATEPMPEEKAIAKLREFEKRNGWTNHNGVLYLCNYRAWTRPVEVTDREAVLYA